MSSSEFGPSGAALLAALTEGRTVSAAHMVLVENAARIADRLDQIEREIPGIGLTTTNHLGTESINPLVSEQRQQLSALSGLLAKLGVSELPKVSSGEKSIRDLLAERRAAREAG